MARSVNAASAGLCDTCASAPVSKQTSDIADKEAVSAASASSTRDLTSGKPMPLILGFLLPLLAGYLFQQFYNIVDTMIVGRTLGVSALAGVGSTGSVNFLVVGFCMGTCSGFAVPISQRFGAGDYSGMRKLTVHSLYLAVFFMIVLTTATALLTTGILKLMGTPEDIFVYAHDYILVIFLGIPAIMAYNLLSAVIRALGNSRAPVVFLVIASVSNIFLDLLFIITFHMGVMGAALATDISQGFSALLAAGYIVKKMPILHPSREELKAEGRLFKILFTMGVPMGLQFSVTSIGSVTLQSAVNSLGSVMVASMTAANKVSGFFACPFDALGATMSTYAGQNVGAGKLGRLNNGLRSGAILGAAYAVSALVILYFFADDLILLFLDSNNADVVSHARTLLLFYAAFYVPLMFVNEVRLTIQGMGYSAFAIFSGVCEMVARIFAALILIPILGWTGACLASPLAWVTADCFLFPAYYFMRRKTYRILGLDPGKGIGSFHEEE